MSPVLDNFSVIVSATVSVGALAVSVVAHRHQVRRDRLLDARETRVEAAEQRLEHQADRTASRTQASMIDVRVVWTQSQLVDSMTPGLKLTNRSSQPVWGLAVYVTDMPVSEVPTGLSAGDSRTVTITPQRATDADTHPERLTVNFTDAAGVHWRRDGTGGLRRGTLLESGEWAWGSREEPDIDAFPYYFHVPSIRRRRWPWVALVLLVVVACVIWIVSPH